MGEGKWLLKKYIEGYRDFVFGELGLCVGLERGGVCFGLCACLERAGVGYPTVDEVSGSGILEGGLELQGGTASNSFSPLAVGSRGAEPWEENNVRSGHVFAELGVLKWGLSEEANQRTCGSRCCHQKNKESVRWGGVQPCWLKYLLWGQTHHP